MLQRFEGQQVTLLLVAVNVAVSLYAFSQYVDRRPTDRFVFEPAEVARGRNLGGMVFSQFSHADVAHLVFNMITLYFFGPVVEGLLGPGSLVLIYLAAAAGATALIFAMHRNDPTYRALGASGATTGVLFAAIVLVPSMEVSSFPVPVPIPAPIFALLYIALSIFAAKRRIGNIGHEAHIGGALVGLALAGALSPLGFAPLLEHLRQLLHRGRA